MDKENKKEVMDPIMMEEDQIKNIMETVGRMHSGLPYQYKMNNKMRSIVDKEGLASDEEDVDDLWAMEHIDEILCITYERKKRGPREGIEGITPIQFTISVEPTTPCVTNTPERTSRFRKLNFSGRKTAGNTSKQGETTRAASLGSNSQISTPHGGSSST
jgi:hypothetical protein